MKTCCCFCNFHHKQILIARIYAIVACILVFFTLHSHVINPFVMAPCLTLLTLFPAAFVMFKLILYQNESKFIFSWRPNESWFVQNCWNIKCKFLRHSNGFLTDFHFDHEIKSETQAREIEIKLIERNKISWEFYVRLRCAQRFTDSQHVSIIQIYDVNVGRLSQFCGDNNLNLCLNG